MQRGPRWGAAASSPGRPATAPPTEAFRLRCSIAPPAPLADAGTALSASTIARTIVPGPRPANTHASGPEASGAPCSAATPAVKN